MIFSAKLTVGGSLHIVLTFLVNSVASVTLSSLKQVLAEVKHGCPMSFGKLHPHSLLDTIEVLVGLG